MSEGETPPMPLPSRAAIFEVCSVRAGQTFFGIPIAHILEIMGGARPLRVPLAPSFIGGLVHYRGDVLTAVSLRRVLGLPPREGAQDILVIENGGWCFALLVDAVGEVLKVSAGDHEPNPSTLDEHCKALFAGAYKLQDKLLVMLDPERLDPRKLRAMQAA